MSTEKEGKTPMEDNNGEMLKRMDSKCSRKHKSQKQPSGAFLMDKDGFANRLSQIKSTGSVDVSNSSVTKENKIEKLDLSQVTDDDAKENIIKEKSVTEEDIVSGEEACIENVDENPTRKVMDTSSTDSIKAASEVVFPEETTTPIQCTDREDGTNDMDVVRKSSSIEGTGKDAPEAIDDDSRSRNPSIADVSDADSVIMNLKANTYTVASALIRGTRENAKKDAKEIIEKQKEKRSHSYSKKVIPPIGRGRYASDADTQPSKTNKDSRAKDFLSRCPCDAIKRDPKLKTKVCTIT